MKKIFSGIQPSGNIHIGNYLGAIKQWIKTQDEQESKNIFCIVDLHAITIPQDSKQLQNKILELAALYIAAGVNLQKSKIFIQSSRPEHAELAWILNCFARMGELKRMTQFKEKTEKQTNYSVGLFNYPILMAADILLYQTTHVPVGEDQIQHIELTRDIAQRINSKYGQIVTVPEPQINKVTTRIMGLDNPQTKMSKSASSPANYIALTDEPEAIRQKIKRAVTDSGKEIKARADKPAISNLLNIFAGVSDTGVSEIEKGFEDKNYGEFKQALAEEIIKLLAPIQKKYNALRRDEAELRKILADGSDAVAPIAQKTLEAVKSKIGLG